MPENLKQRVLEQITGEADPDIYYYLNNTEMMIVLSNLTDFSLNYDEETKKQSVNFFLDGLFATYEYSPDDHFWDLKEND